MDFLAIDTSRKIMEITANIGGKDYYYADKAALRSSVTLMPAIDDCLKISGVKIGDINCLGVCVGPGSFTGIRIGVTTVKALAYAANLQIVGFNTLEMLAYCVFDSDSGKDAESVISVLDSGNGNYYLAAYNKDGLAVTELLAPCVMTDTRLGKFLDTVDEPAIIIADCDIAAVNRHINIYRADNCRQAMERIMRQAAQGTRPFLTHAELEPLYIQLSQAEKDLLCPQK